MSRGVGGGGQVGDALRICLHQDDIRIGSDRVNPLNIERRLGGLIEKQIVGRGCGSPGLIQDRKAGRRIE